MSDQIAALKVKCFDLQEANTSLSNYLVEIAKALGVNDLNEVYPTVVGLVGENEELRSRLEPKSNEE